MGNDQIPKKERGYITKQINSHTSNKTENMVWTDSQDHGEDEILHTSKTMLFHKTTRFISEIPTLFRVPPQLFRPNPAQENNKRCAAKHSPLRTFLHWPIGIASRCVVSCSC